MRTTPRSRSIAAVVPLLVLAACSGQPVAAPPELGASSPSETPEPSAAPVDAAYVDVDPGPVGIAAGDGAVWVVSAEEETVSRIPARAGKPDLTVDVPGIPLRVAV